MNAYFVYDYYSVAGSPKAEAAVMDYARKNYLYMLISERALDAVVKDLKAYMYGVLEGNKRLKPVDLRMSEDRLEFNGHRTLYIGSNSLRLRKVKDSLFVKAEDLL